MKILSRFRQELQEQTNWCWAAVAVSVADFYQRGNWLQCTLVTRATGRSGCCASPGSCNVMFSAAEALELTECLSGHADGSVALDALQRQIDFDCPVVIRLEDRDGLGHVMTIVGYGPGEGDRCLLTIRDPFMGNDTVIFGDLKAGRHRGSWSDTYFTA